MNKELIDFIQELENRYTEEYNLIRAKAYNVRIEENYAIHLRDEFNKNDGKFETLKEIQRKILELVDKNEEE